MRTVYMDYNATTPVLPEVISVMEPFYAKTFGNEESIHAFGVEAKSELENARKNIAKILGVNSPEIYFTSCATESNNTVIKGIAFANLKKKGRIITSSIEHSAVLAPSRWLDKLGFEIVELPVDSTGLIDPDDLRNAITPDTILISIMWANNEVGTIQPIEELANIAKENGIMFHTDAVQVAGKIPIDLSKLPIDFLSLSAHKFYGPKGVGLLYAKRGKRFESLIHGGGHEHNKRAGTVNVGGAVGMAKALEIVNTQLESENNRLAELSETLLNGVMDRVKIASFNGNKKYRLANTLNLSFRGIEGEAMLMGLDSKGIAVSSGSACSSANLTVSHVLSAMDVDLIEAQGAIRISLGRYNDTDDIQYFLENLPPVVERLKSFSAL